MNGTIAVDTLKSRPNVRAASGRSGFGLIRGSRLCLVANEGWRPIVNRFSTWILCAAGILVAGVSSAAAFGADVKMEVVKNDYLGSQGFDVMLYDSTYHPVFVDQKNTAME